MVEDPRWHSQESRRSTSRERGGIRSKIAESGGIFFDHEARHVRPIRFYVLAIHAVVADLRRGHGDDLSAIGRIGEDFLVPRDRRVENDFAGPCARRSESPALEDTSIFEGKEAF